MINILKILQLANNNIENIKNLDDMKLVEINLFGNRIIDLNGLSRLPFLRKLDLSRNGIEKLYIKINKNILDLED